MFKNCCISDHLGAQKHLRDCAVEGRVVTRLAIQSWLIAVNLILCQFCWAYLLLKKGFSIFRLLILEQSKNRTI